MRDRVETWLRNEARPAAVTGAVVGFLIGLIDALAVLRGAYDPWLVSRRLAPAYPVIEAAWWAAIFLAIPVAVSVARGIGTLLFGPEQRRLALPAWVVYAAIGVAVFILVLQPGPLSGNLWPSVILAGRKGALFSGLTAGAFGAVAVLLVSRFRWVTSVRATSRRAAVIRPAAVSVFALALIAALGVASRWRSAGDGPRPDASGDDRPNILWITVDALRGDALSCLSGTAPPTPAMDGLAKRGVVFTEAFSQAPWTLPSFGSMMTSRYPSEVGISLVEGVPFMEQKGNAYPLASDVPVLAELLRDAGYTTATQLTVLYTSGKYGMDRGFVYNRHCNDRRRSPKFYDGLRALIPAIRPDHRDIDAEAVTKGAVTWLREERRSPFFLWVHYADPHAPYGSPEALAKSGDQHKALVEASHPREAPRVRDAARSKLRELYDGEVTYVDHWIGRLLESLGALGEDKRTVVILTADHGEAMWEEGSLGHGHQFYYEITHVPLIIAFPGGRWAGHRVADPVRSFDIMPTILDLARVATLTELRGESLLPLMYGTDEATPLRRELLMECRYAGPEAKAIRCGPWMVTYWPETDSFDIVGEERLAALGSASDWPSPDELQDRLRQWTKEMDRALSARARVGPALTREDEQRLKALGYL